MFKRILVPTDGSEPSQRAVLAGIGFAKELGAEVVGLTVIPKFHTFTYKTDMLEETKEEFAVDSQRARQESAVLHARRCARGRRAVHRRAGRYRTIPGR